MKRSETDNESGRFSKRFFFFFMGWESGSLLLQMSRRPSLTVFKANDSVLNDTKKTIRLWPQLFAVLFAKALKHPFSNFSFSFIIILRFG